MLSQVQRAILYSRLLVSSLGLQNISENMKNCKTIIMSDICADPCETWPSTMNEGLFLA